MFLELILCVSYELPHRIHTVQVYPVQSPNGSTVIIYGHEHGLRILWRGGKPFRPAAPVQEKQVEQPKVNGASKNTIVILDSDDDDTPPSPRDTLNDAPPTFEDEDDEYDPSEPYLPILQHLDLALGAEVLHVAFPHIPSESARSISASVPPILLHKVIVAAACSDYSIRIITIPLPPPSPASKAHIDIKSGLTFAGNGKGPHGVQVFTLSGSAAHQTIPSGVTITYTSHDAGRNGRTADGDIDIENEDDEEPRSPLTFRRRPSPNKPSEAQRNGERIDWDIVLASHSPEISGMILVYRIPIVKTASGSSADHTLSVDHLLPSQAQYLSSPATRIAFNSSLYPSSRHSHLLVTSSEGAMRVYDCFPFGEAKQDRQGSWLISLYPPYDSSSTGSPSRKRIIDAAWVLNGRGILVLLADGEWGVWDLEGSGSDTQGNSRRKGNGNPGNATATFAFSGCLGSTASTVAKSSSGKPDTKSKLAPMTPGTRRVREEVLFSGPPAKETYQMRGGISVTRLEHSATRNTSTEAVTLWHGSKILTIPDLFSYCQSGPGGKGNLFSGESPQRSPKANDLNVGGEMINAVDQLPLSGTEGNSHRDLVLAAEHRLVFLTAPLEEPQPEESTLSEADEPNTTDQQLLARGELDVGGMERILANMTNGSGNGDRHGDDFSNGTLEMTGRRKVYFADT